VAERDRIAEFKEVVELMPDDSASHRGLGRRALERAGRRDEAQAAYRKGLDVAARIGDLQTKKEIEVFLHRLDTAGG
jgi:hypothetical protein